jgi:hypothetical protein
MHTVLLLLPEPRSYAGTAIVMGAATGLPFAILWSWLVSALLQRSFGEFLSTGVGFGLFFGVAFGLTRARRLPLQSRSPKAL